MHRWKHTAAHTACSDLPIWEVAERMNFANPSFFSKFFKREIGMTPAEYRNG